MKSTCTSLAGDPGGLRQIHFVLRREDDGRWAFISRELVHGYHKHASACVERGEACPSFDEWLLGGESRIEEAAGQV